MDQLVDKQNLFLQINICGMELFSGYSRKAQNRSLLTLVLICLPISLLKLLYLNILAITLKPMFQISEIGKVLEVVIFHSGLALIA